MWWPGTLFFCKIIAKKFFYVNLFVYICTVIKNKINKMAYLEKNKLIQIRKEIKKTFSSKQGWKFSIRMEHYSGVRIVILSAPVNFTNRPGTCIRPTRETHPYLQQIYNIANMGNHDNSDVMTDYFDIGWYIWLNVGSYDKPFQFIKA